MSYFSDSLLKQVRAYARGHADSSRNLYSQRNQSTRNLEKTIYISKLCEYYVYFHLLNSGRKCLPPDLKIYEAWEKSYEADLFCHSHGVHIHVKSITRRSAEKYGLSWVIQADDPLILRPQSNHWYALVEYIGENDIRLVGWLNSLVAIYKPTRLKHPSKTAIYYKDNSQFL